MRSQLIATLVFVLEDGSELLLPQLERKALQLRLTLSAERRFVTLTGRSPLVDGTPIGAGTRCPVQFLPSNQRFALDAEWFIALENDDERLVVPMQADGEASFRTVVPAGTYRISAGLGPCLVGSRPTVNGARTIVTCGRLE